MRRSLFFRTIAAVGLAAIISAPALADGNETLGPPSITIQQGTGAVGAGVGMEGVTSGTIDVTVPARGALILAPL